MVLHSNLSYLIYDLILNCVGISRDSMHKRRATGGKKKAWRKKRKSVLKFSFKFNFLFNFCFILI